MIQKHVLVPQRLRRPPHSGWSWVDRAFVRDHAEQLSREALLLYFYLAAVSDRHGLSFRNDATVAIALRLPPDVVARAREELVERDLIAFDPPLTQVLSLPPPRSRRQVAPGQGLLQLGDLFRQIAGEPLESSDTRRTRGISS